MRMWMVNPEFLCRKHLLGEHYELHMLVGALNKNKNIQGYLDKELVFPREIHKRHSALVSEMEKRGYSHDSFILPFIIRAPYLLYKSDTKIIKRNVEDLCNRCIQCHQNVVALGKISET